MAQGSTAKSPQGEQIAFMRKRIDFGDVADATVSRYTMGVIPANSQILFCAGAIKTGFSAAGTRALTVGSNGTTANNILTTISEETATSVQSLLGGKLSFASDTTIYAKLTTVGTAAAAGQAELVLAYVPPTQENL